MVSEATILQLAWAGLHPDRVRSLIEADGVSAVVRRLRSGRIKCSEAAKAAVTVGAVERRRQLGSLGVWFAERRALPPWLSDLPDSPWWLFGRGGLPAIPGVAVVGARRATTYGLGVAEAIGRALAACGWPVVSGLAAGIDGAAHRGALDAGGSTVAVLGCGIDVWYPARNRRLGEQILASGGAVVSEFGPGIRPDAWRFPARNRIISGLSSAVVVVEAADQSGALITARVAVEQGREVFAVPGDIGRSTSVGCNRLIRDGAYPVVDVPELLEALEMVMGPPPRPHPEQGALLWSLLGPTPGSLDELVEQYPGEPAALMVELSRLEVSGAVRIEEGIVYRQ